MKKFIAGVTAVISAIYTLGIIGAADAGASNSYFIPRVIVSVIILATCAIYINIQQNRENRRRNRHRGTN